ncbi:MAG: M28 family peptidase, partial [Gottschalkiaceae bacterium]
IIDDLKYKVDYYLESWYSNSIDRLEGEIITVDTYLSKEYTPSKNYILLLNPNGSQNVIYDKLVNERKEHKHIKGVIVPDIKYSTFIQKRNDLDEKGLTRVLDNVQAYNETAPPIKINVGKIAAMKLWKLEGSKVLINSFIDNQEGLVGKNIGGIIQGKNQENPIIIATTYDYLGFHDLGATTGVEDFTKYKGLYENGTSIAGSLEIAKNLGNIKQTPERSIIFMFIDGSKITIEGFLDIEKQGILDEQPLLILLRFMGINKWGRTEDSLYYNTIVNSNIGLEQDFHKWLRRNSSKDYFIIGDNQISERNLLVLSDKDMVGIVLQGIKEKERGLHYGMVQSNVEEIDTDRLTAHIQYLLDSIIDMVYGKIWLK